MSDKLLFDVSEGVATLTLNRPEAANALDLELAEELMRAAIRCDESPAIRAVVLTGAGKLFCAGGDLGAFASAGDGISGLLKELTVYLHGALSRFARMDSPLLVAVNGTAAGAGLSMAIAGDYALIAESAKVTMAYTAAGLVPDGSSSYWMPRLIGVRRTAELMMTNRRLSAVEAVEWGLFNATAHDDEVLAETQKLAAQLAAGPTRSFGAVKRLLATSFGNGLETQMELEAREISAASVRADGQEGIAAFLEKRKPEFRGE